jgi:hypothetical protein
MATEEKLEALHELATQWIQAKEPWHYVFGANVLEVIDKHPELSVAKLIQKAKREAEIDMRLASKRFADEFEDYWAEVWAEP